MTETVCELADERPVHFYDQLGCGRSDKAADPDFYSPQRYVRELAEVCDALGLGEVCLMGFSWGGDADGHVFAGRKSDRGQGCHVLRPTFGSAELECGSAGKHPPHAASRSKGHPGGRAKRGFWRRGLSRGHGKVRLVPEHHPNYQTQRMSTAGKTGPTRSGVSQQPETHIEPEDFN